MQESTQAKIEELRARAARRETTRYSASFKDEAVSLVDELRQQGWTQKDIHKELGIPWVTLNRWASKNKVGGREGGKFRPVQVVDSPATPALVSPSGWRIEGLSVAQLVELAGRL